MATADTTISIDVMKDLESFSVSNHLKTQFSELSPYGGRHHRAEGAILRPIIHKRA